MKDLCGKNIVVTGGSRGIGKSITLELLKYGANVVATYNNSVVNSEDFFYEGEDLLGNLYLVHLDQSNSESINKFF